MQRAPACSSLCSSHASLLYPFYARCCCAWRRTDVCRLLPARTRLELLGLPALRLLLLRPGAPFAVGTALLSDGLRLRVVAGGPAVDSFAVVLGGAVSTCSAVLPRDCRVAIRGWLVSPAPLDLGLNAMSLPMLSESLSSELRLARLRPAAGCEACFLFAGCASCSPTPGLLGVLSAGAAVTAAL
jgi:hypothetical protein